MAIRVGGTDVIDNSLGLKNIASVDATTADAISAAGVGGGKADFVASGTIANGDVVILNSDGTVTSAGLSPTDAGTSTTFNTENSNHISGAYDSSNNKVIVTYVYSTSVKVMVGTVSGTSITFGSAVTLVSGYSFFYTKTIYDSINNKVVIAFKNDSLSKSTAYVGTVSGTSISFGSPTDFENSGYLDGVFDTTSGKVVLTYSYFSNTSYRAIVGTVSGTSISFGTSVEYSNTASYLPTRITYDSANSKVVMLYLDGTSAKAIVGTVSGTSISFGTEVTLDTVTSDSIEIVYDSGNSKVVFLYNNKTPSPAEYKAIVGTVSGTSISLGTPVTWFDELEHDIYKIAIRAVYDTSANKVVVSYVRRAAVVGATNTNHFSVGTVSGTSISFATSVEFYSGSTNPSADLDAVFDTANNKVVVLYKIDNPYYGAYSVITSGGATNLTDTNLIGVSTEAISDTATGTINIIGGINESQTGLTTGTTYYAADDGSLSTTNNGRKVGKAISSTKLLVDTAMSGPEMNAYLGGLV